MLYLNAETLSRAAFLSELMDAIEEAYAIVVAGNYEMPHRMHVNKEDNTLLYMPCFLDNIFGTKILSLFPANAGKNLPVISGLVLLNDRDNGIPLAILDGGRLTALRTGAVGGVAVRHRTPENITRAGLIGAGIQGYYQMIFAADARELNEIVLYDRDYAKAEKLALLLKDALPRVKVGTVRRVEELLDIAQLVITATPAEEPVLPDDPSLLRGKSFVGIGSYKPEMREYPQALFTLIDRVYVDTLHSLEESGDLITPLQQNWLRRDQVIDFSNYLSGQRRAVKEGETTFFKSVGMALFDITVGAMLYRRASEKGLGIRLE